MARIHVPAADLTSRRRRVERIELQPGELHFTTEGGELLHGRGYRVLLHPGGRELGWYDSETERLWDALRILPIRVAGLQYHREDAQAQAFAPGTAVRLRHEPGAGDDPNAVSIRDETGALTPGWVPRRHAEHAVTLLREHERPAALIVWEWRDATGSRCGLRALLGPPGLMPAVELTA